MVDEVFAVEAVGGGLALLATMVEEFVGLAGGEALVEQVVGEGGVLGEEFGGEGFGLGGLRAPGTVGVQGKTYDKGADLMFADEAADGFEVGVQFGAVQGEEGLGRETEAVGDGEADAAVAYVESHDAAEGHGHSVGGWVLFR